MDHQVENDPDVGRAKGVGREPFGVHKLGTDRQFLERLQGRVESLDVADLQDRPRCSGLGDELLGLGQRAGHRLLDQGGDAPFEEGPGDFPVQAGGYGDRDGVDKFQEWPVVSQCDRAAFRGDGLGLLDSGVGDRHQLDSGHRGQDPGMVLAQMAYPHDADSQALHVVLHRSRARPCLPRC